MPPPLDGFRYDDEDPATSAAKPVTPAQSTPVALPGFRYDDEPAPTSTATTPEPTPSPAPTAPGGLTGFRYDDEPVPPVPPAQPVPVPVPVPGQADNLATPNGIYGDPDMPAMPVADPNDKRQGGLDSMVAGLVDAMREGRQLASGDAFSSDNIPAPVDRTFAGKIGYGFAHGTPTLASMVLGAAGGAAAGSAVAPGPGTAVGGVLGGAAGGGLMDFAQSLIPAYQDATRRGLDHDAAVDEAYKVAASSGLLTGATAPLFALRPFKSTISNLLLHGAGTGPAIGAVKRGVIGPAITGQPAPGIDEMISNALEDAIGGGVTMGAMHAGPAIARHFMPDTRPELNITPEPPLPGPRQITGAPGVAPEPPPVAPVPSTEPPPAPPPGPAPGVAPVIAVPPPVTPAPTEPTPTPGTPPNVIPPAIAPEPAPVVPPTVPRPVLPEPPVVTPAPGTVAPTPVPVPGADPTGTVPVAPGAQPVAPGEPTPGVAPTLPTPSPVEQPGTVAGTTPETSALQPGAGEAAPTVPEPAQPGGIAEAIRELDKRGASDDDYRGLLSTASKDELKPGETWRERAMRVAESQQPVETPEPVPTPAPTPITTEPPATPPVPTPPVEGVPAPRPPAPETTSPVPAREATPAWRAEHPDVPDTLYRGSGRTDQAAAYNPAGGTPIPILGPGRYAAFSEEHAKTYGPNVERTPLDLKNPLVIRSDEQWKALTKEAGWAFPNPFGLGKEVVARNTQAMRDLVQSKGHDGVIVHWDDRTDRDIDSQGRSIKTLRNVFGDPQVVDYRAAPPQESSPAPAPVPAKPVPVKAGAPVTRTTTADQLKPGDVIRTPGKKNLTVESVSRDKTGAVIVRVEGRAKALPYGPKMDVKVHAETPVAEPTELEARQGAVARPQRKSAPVPGAPAPLPKRIRTLKTPESTPAPQAGAPMTQEDISYSAGTPRYQEAFVQAMAGTGMDPRTAMNKPLDEQVTMLTRAVQDKYGFGRVDIVADSGVDLKTTRDLLLNMHQNMQGMAHAMNWPNEVLSLNGRLNLKLVPRNFEGKHWMGMYAPATKTIHVSGGSNSYAHEHWHAIDEYLSDLLNTDPNKATLFSHAARHDQLDANKTTHTAFANVLNTLFYDQGELALRRLALERTAAKTDPATGQPTVAAREAQEQIRKLDTGASKLRIPPSMFRASAAQMPDPAYYASAHELVARAGEAYTAWAMRNAGVRTEGVVKPDEGYQNQLLAYMKAAYPNAQDRTNIFKAFGDLRTELERASVLPLKGPGALPPSDQHTVPPTHTRPAEVAPGLMARIKADLQAIKWSNLRGGDHESVVSPGEQVQPPLIYTGKNNAPVRQTRGVRHADTLGEHWLSPLGNMERWIEQIPPKARPAMRKLRDMLGHDPGSGRLIDQTFEERARHNAQKATALLEDIFRDAGLVHRVTKRTHLTRTDQQDLWHTLATGDTTYPLDAHDVNKTGETRPIRSEIIEAAKKIRLDIFEKSYDTAKASGLPIGHTKEGYVPRVMNDAKILSDPQTFTKDIAKINGIIQDNDFAASNEEPPVRLAKWWSDTEKRVRDSPAAFTDEQRAAMTELVRNLNRINAINAELAAGGAVNPTSHNPAALRVERDTLEARNQDIHDEHGQGVLDAIALNEAQNMTRRIITGKPQDFTTLGPRSEFLRQRTLPPEADQVLRNWYVSDPKVAIPMYIHSMSRKLAYHEVFGPSGNNVTALIHEAQAAGMHGDHVRKFQDVVETVTGRSTRQGNSADTRIFNAISAWGELITMSGATLSALAEPTAMVLHGGSFKQVLKVYSNLMGQFFGTMEGAERMRIARQIGAISSVLQGSAMANRATDYSGTPVMGAIVNNFFELAMSPAIRMIRAATIGPSWSMLKELLEVANAPAKTNHELNRKDDAQRLLRDFGIADHQVGMMHDWAQTVTGEQPTSEQIANTKEGQLWEVVENRVLDRLNVNPTAAEKPMGALKTSYGNMMLGLTSFVWGFFRNGVLPAFRKIGHAGHRQYERAKANGATDRQAWFQAKGSQLQYSMMTAAAAATLILGTGIVGTARTYIFNQDAWAKHAEAGDLLPWLFGNAVSQSGLNGPLDLIGQAYHSLRYTSDLSNLTSGPFLATELRYAVDVVAMVNDIVSGEAKTNTKFYNGVHALLQLAGKPGALIGLTWLMRRLPAGGPLSALVTAASIGGVSTSVTRGITDQIAGPRGTTLPDEPKPGALPKLPDLPELPPLTPGEAKGAQHQETAMTAAIGIADDILMPIIQALPGPAKAAAVGTAAVATMVAAYYRGAQFREQGEPPKTHH